MFRISFNQILSKNDLSIYYDKKEKLNKQNIK